MFASSGVGERPVLTPSKAKCWGKCRGMVGEGAGFAVDSVLTREGSDDVS